MNTYNTWTTPLGATVTEIEHDDELHAFAVEYGGYEVVIVPYSIEEMCQSIRDLNAGTCPIADGWEDGNGRAVSDIFGELLARRI